MALRDLFKNTPIAYRVREVIASRALYESEEIQRVEVKLELETGDKLTIELLPRQAHKLIVQMTSAYEAIHPQIPRVNHYGA